MEQAVHAFESRPRWETYADEIVGKDNAELDAAVAEYARNRYESSSEETKEELARRKEENDGIASEYQWVHPSEYADKGAWIGKILHSSKLITLLREKCRLKCWYRLHPQPQKLTLLILERGKRNIGCWSMFGYMPEFSIMRFDEHGVPLDEAYRGWRTVLMQLALKGVISERKITEVFGPARGPVSARYNRFMGSLRTNFLRGQ